MKRYSLPPIAALLFAAPVFAADMPLKAPPPVVYGWSGFYLGAGVGTYPALAPRKS